MRSRITQGNIVLIQATDDMFLLGFFFASFMLYVLITSDMVNDS